MTDAEYIMNSSGIVDRYNRISSIIAALENQQILMIANAGVEEYSLDDGQTKIHTTYRSADQIAKAINAYDAIRNKLHAQMTGTRIIRLADTTSVQSNGVMNGRL